MGYNNLGIYTPDTPSAVANPTAAYAPYVANYSQGVGANNGITPITPEALTPATPTPFAQPPPTLVPPVPDPTLSTELNPQEKIDQATSDRLTQISTELSGKPADQTGANTQYGVDAAQKTYTDLNARLVGLKNQELAIPLLLEQSPTTAGITTDVFNAQKGKLLRDNAIEALTVSSLMAAAQGQLSNAQALADKAIATKYGPKEAEYDALTRNLTIIRNSPNYTLAQKDRADKQLEIQNAKKDKLDKEKADTVSINKIAVDAAAAGASSEQLTNIGKASSPVEAQRIATLASSGITTPLVNQNGIWINTKTGKEYSTKEELFKDFPQLNGSFDRAYQMNLVTDYSANSAADKAWVTTARNKYLDAGIKLTDTFEQARQKVLASPSYQAEQAKADSGFTLNAGDVRYDAKGNLIASGPPTAPKPLTEAQSKDVTYASRTEEANGYINNLESKIAKYNPTGFLIQTKLEENTITNSQASDEIKQLRQAERNFATAALRRESGAAISASEFTTLEKQYFPRPGDDAQTLKQKAQNRQTAINSFKASNPNNTGASASLQWKDPSTGDVYEFPDQNSFDKFKKDNGISFNSVGNTTASARTDRHNNPTAFTTDIAKLAGLKLGVDYTVGDSFSNGQYQTANLIGDPVAQTIKVIDKIGFKTTSGGNRWTYTDQIPGTKNWKNLSYDQKKKVVAQMYQHEGGSALKSLLA